MSKPTTTEKCDIAIVGGGMIGSCLALALSKLPIKVSLIEPFAPVDKAAPGFDARAIALSRASAKILNSLDLWSSLRPQVTAIEDIHISDRGRPGICRLSAAEVNIPAMGYVVELERSGKVLHHALQQADLNLLCPARVTAITKGPQGWDLTLDNEGQVQHLESSLVIAADGGNSSIRAMLELSYQEKSYYQAAIVSTIQSQLPHKNQAFERFTDNGPVALLPLSDNRISLVWMLPPETAKEMVDCSDKDFLSALQQAFGYRLGRLERVGERHMYPLSLRCTNASKEGVLFIGNAAQSLHPIAGQGFNLGLRDVADLVDTIRDACINNIPLTDPKLQESYQTRRSADKELIITMTDGLARLFANPSHLLTVPRNLMLNILASAPLVRHEFGRYAMGMNHPAARLTRGLDISLKTQ